MTKLHDLNIFQILFSEKIASSFSDKIAAGKFFSQTKKKQQDKTGIFFQLNNWANKVPQAHGCAIDSWQSIH